MTRLQSVAILASAGSGKTYVLTSRFLALLLNGVAPDRILAVTFTRAAAREILDRILRRLADACESDSAAQKLRDELTAADTIPLGRLTAGACRAALRSLADALDRLRVGTIDSFFAHAAGALALELDLPSAWRIADEDLDQSMRAMAVETVVEQLETSEITSLVRRLHRGMHSPRVFSAVLDAVAAAYDAFRDAPPEAWSRIAPRTEPMPPDRLAHALAQLAAAPLGRTRTGEVHKAWATTHAAAVNAVSQADWEAFVENGLVGALPKGTYHKAEITDAFRAACEPLLHHARAILLGRLRDQNLATRESLSRYHAASSDLRRRLALLTFDDIPRALLDAEAGGNLEHFYYALDGRVDHALIDEFQDTSVTQFRLLRPLLEEIVSDETAARSLMCVGDVKQSLYQWRHAEPELLPLVPRLWSVVREDSLDTSYRSAPEIIDAVNTVFSGLDRNPALTSTDEGAEAARRWSARFHPHSTARDFRGYVSLRTSGTSEAQHVAAVCTHIADLARAAPGTSIGVLFPRRGLVPRTLALLRELGVDAAVESGSGVIDSPAVAAFLSLLHLADFPGDTAAAFHVATSPLGPAVGLAHPAPPASVDRVAAALRRELFEQGYARTLTRLASLVSAHGDARDADRLERLVRFAERFDAQAGTRPSEFVRAAAVARSEDPPTAQVRLLTVHGSKGLEFDTVVLADLDDPLKSKRPVPIVIERAGPLDPITTVTRYASEAVRRGDPRLEDMHRRAVAAQIGERLSVLYVAMTRAARRLDMFIRPRKADCSIQKTYAGLLHAALCPDAVRDPAMVLWTTGREPPAPARPPAPKAPAAPAPPVGPAPRITLPAGPPRPSRAQALSPSRAGAPRPANVAEALAAAPASHGRDRGTLVHAWLEHLEWLDDSFTIETLRSISATRALPWDDLASRTAAMLVDGLRAAPSRDLLEKAAVQARHPGASLRAHRERPIAVLATPPGENEPRLIVGRLDRLVVASRDGRPVAAEIIDFKTDSVAATGPDLVAAYATQLNAYRAAVAAMLSLPLTRVSCALALVLTGSAVRID